jgi:SpoIID/LytB domain protein
MGVLRLRDFPLVTPRPRIIGALIFSALVVSSTGALAQTDTSVAPLAPEAAAPPPAPTTTIAPKRTLVITGKGFGHGRGLGQWGAYGYAIDKGWTSPQILDHYYGGTVPGGLAPTSALGVRITNLDAKPLTLFQPKGRLYLRLDNEPGLLVPPAFVAPTVVPLAPDPVVGAAVTVPDGAAAPTTTIANAAVIDPPLASGNGAAIRIRLARGAWEVSDAPSCGGPWTVRTALSARMVTVTPGPTDTAASPDDQTTMLHVCEDGQRRVYRGDFLAITDGKVQRGVNLVGMEAYLRGVVPREISASWGDRGIEAVKAQAVAARSYAAAEKRSGFSNTCDTISCQVYGGRGIVDSKGFRSLEDPRTDRAIAETAGEIRVNPKTGTAIRTEFSASTGGHTAGGEFPAVPDDGDNTAGNPNVNWERRLAGSAVRTSTKLGPLVDAKVTARDGFGVDGGRATKVALVYERGTVSVSGNEFMRSFSLKSSYFSTQMIVEGAPAAAPADTVVPLAPDTAPGQALTGDAGGPVAAAGALPAGALTPSATPESTAVEVTTTTKKTKTKTTTVKTNPNTTIVAVAVAVGASPVVTVVGGADVGSPTTIKPVAKKKKK